MLQKNVRFPIYILAMLICIGIASCDKVISSSNANKLAYDSVVNLAESCLSKHHYEQAYKYFTASKAFCTDDQAEKKIYTLGNLAEIYRVNGDYVESEATATEAFRYFDACKSPAYKVYIYNCLGINFQEKEDFAKALLYYNKAYKTATTEADRAIIQNNMAVVYLEKKDYNSAVRLLKPLIANDTLHKFPENLAKALDNLGFTYFNLKRPQAYDYLSQALAIRDSLKSDFESIPSYIHLSKFYQTENPKRSLDYAQKALAAATRVNNPEDRLESLDLLIHNSEGKVLKQYYAAYAALNNHTIKTREKARRAFATIKYDSKKAVKEKENLKAFTIWGGMALCLLAFIIITDIKYRNRKKLRKSVYETETRIAKKIHDELANDVFQNIQYIENHDLNNKEYKEALLGKLDDIYTRTRSISQQNSEINTEEGYEDFLLDLLNSYGSENVNVIINKAGAMDWGRIRKESKIALYRVLHELMVNMKKHSGATLVVIGFVNNPKSIEIKYSDNGKGAKLEANHKKGLHNAENRIHAVKGTIIFEQETGKGFRVTITIPK
jgi:tetratricopeptide (TPR) repeat protein